MAPPAKGENTISAWKADLQHLLRPLPEPHLVVSADGTVEACNLACLHLWELDRPPSRLHDLVDTEVVDLDRCMSSWSASPTFLPQRLRLRHGGEWTECVGRGARLPLGDEVLILLRLQPREKANRQFAELNRKLRELAHEIEHRRQVEAELRAAEARALAANLAKDRLLANVSHEIRTPMNGILGMAELLLDSALTDEQREYAGTIRSSTESLLAVVNSILDLSKLEAGGRQQERTSFDPELLAEEVMSLLSHRALPSVNLIVVPGPNMLPVVRGDAGSVRQVLLNLVSNAVSFTEEGRVVIRCGLEDGKLTYRVEDTGVGIPAEYLQRIFEPFHQVDASTRRRHGGTGLGLTISRKIVELLGGTLGVESEPGRGSTFWFRVPVERGPKSAPASAERGPALLVTRSEDPLDEVMAGAGFAVTRCLPEDVPADLSSFGLVLHTGQLREVESLRGVSGLVLLCPTTQKALVCSRLSDPPRLLTQPVSRRRLVNLLEGDELESSTSVFSIRLPEDFRVALADDNVINRRVTALQLQKLGCTPVLAKDGQELLDLLEHHPVDLVLLDLQMPVMDGYQAADRIRRQPERYGTPVLVALTAHAGSEDRRLCLEAGLHDYLAKPADARSLARVLSRWANASPPGSAASLQKH